MKPLVRLRVSLGASPLSLGLALLGPVRGWPESFSAWTKQGDQNGRSYIHNPVESNQETNMNPDDWEIASTDPCPLKYISLLHTFS